MKRDPELSYGCLPMILLILVIIIASCSIQHQINREWKSSPPQARMNLLDSYFTVKENWRLGYERNRIELDSIVKLIRNK
jgi:hypothetical protein